MLLCSLTMFPITVAVLQNIYGQENPHSCLGFGGSTAFYTDAPVTLP